MKRARDSITYFDGDLLTHPCDLIVHQCNCLTVRNHGLAAVIAEAMPEADIYARRAPVRAGRNLARPEDRGVPARNLVCSRPAGPGEAAHARTQGDCVPAVYRMWIGRRQVERVPEND